MILDNKPDLLVFNFPIKLSTQFANAAALGPRSKVVASRLVIERWFGDAYWLNT